MLGCNYETKPTEYSTFLRARERNVTMASLRRLSQLFKPLLAHTRSRGRCWAAIRLSHRPERSGRAVHGEVDGLDIGGQHG